MAAKGTARRRGCIATRVAAQLIAMVDFCELTDSRKATERRGTACGQKAACFQVPEVSKSEVSMVRRSKRWRCCQGQ